MSIPASGDEAPTVGQLSPGKYFFVGVDIGASAAKVVVIDRAGDILGWAVSRSGVDFSGAAEKLLDQALEKAGLTRNDIAAAVSTGYGRRNVSFAGINRTEISCHAAGCYHYFPEALTVIDIGGQDNKIIKIDASGSRTGFKMNRKCAAGTGAFLEEMALRLDIPLDEMDALAGKAEQTVELGSYCTVFTATEILEKIRAGLPVPGIVRGIYHSIAKRILEMDSITDAPVLSGGVAAHNPVLAEIFSQLLGRRVSVPPRPQLMGALGAALFAAGRAGQGE
ncbi:MAG: acyl-CoA dehydratase activase [Pseudomonadota bacterium]